MVFVERRNAAREVASYTDALTLGDMVVWWSEGEVGPGVFHGSCGVEIHTSF